jgi:hypothetical protein
MNPPGLPSTRSKTPCAPHGWPVTLTRSPKSSLQGRGLGQLPRHPPCADMPDVAYGTGNVAFHVTGVDIPQSPRPSPGTCHRRDLTATFDEDDAE